MKPRSILTPLAAGLLLAACVSLPEGPSSMALPGSGKNFSEFRNDDAACRNFALQQIGGNTPSQTANQSTVSGAAVGALIGAAAGAALGNNGNAAAAGAGIGLLMGTAVGSDNGRYSSYTAQRRYDQAYQQCMYANGHKVPVYGAYTANASTVQVLTPASAQPIPQPAMGAPIPPPPPGSPPPPPPGVR